MASMGSHCILEMYNCPAGILNDLAFVREAIRDAAEVSGSTLLHEIQHAFSPQGVTALALLAESHISVHTWPESGYAAADVFTCGEHTLPEKACELLVTRLQARRYALRRLERGLQAPHQQPSSAPIPADAPQEDDSCPVRNFVRTSG